jgi:long-chain acyl-CoA synthetase
VFFSVPRLWVKFQQGVQRQDAAGQAGDAAEDPHPGGIVRKKVLGAWA